MADVLVLGGGVCGSAMAILLAREGHEVTILERDPQPAPETVEEAWERWERKGVGQFHLPHYVHARFRHILDADLPDVRDALAAAGAYVHRQTEPLPESITDREPRAEDDRWRTITARRPVLEQVFARAAESEPGVTVRRGVIVENVLTGAEVIPNVPHVIGARTSDGQEILADFVVDAMGRRSTLPDWIVGATGRRPIEEAEDCGFTYYGRYYRSDDGSVPEARIRLLTEYDSFSVLTLPSDNGTWSVTIYSTSGDMPLKKVRFVDRFNAVIKACPLQAHWLEGEPLTDVLAMSGIIDRYRRFVVEGMPVVTGIAAIGDAWASTNPSLGRGLSLGLMQVARLRDLVRESLGAPKEMAERWDEITEAEIAPWYWAQIEMDRARAAAIDAAREGREMAPADDPASQIRTAFMIAAMHDGDVYRGFADIMTCMAPPEEVLSRPGMFEKILSAAEGKEVETPPGPTRQELLELVS